jgi:hypothetical protein
MFIEIMVPKNLLAPEEHDVYRPGPFLTIAGYVTSDTSPGTHIALLRSATSKPASGYEYLAPPEQSR